VVGRAIPALPVPARLPAWESLLAGSAAAGMVVVLVSPLWTGQILEVLHCERHGRRYLTADGTIGEYPPDSMRQRLVHATIDQARAWHQLRALHPLGAAGTHCARFTFGDCAGAGRLSFPSPFQETN
jgi:hypothetical protein